MIACGCWQFNAFAKGVDIVRQRPPGNELLSVLNAAAELGDYSFWTFRRQIAAGHVAVVRLGRRVFVRRDEIVRIRKEGLPPLRSRPSGRECKTSD